MELAVVRHDWTHQEVKALFEMPFNDLLFKVINKLFLDILNIHKTGLIFAKL